MIAKQIAGLVERRIRQIQGLPEHPRRAALANLRRGIGRAPGELPELWGSFLQEMPPEFFSRNGNPTAAEWAEQNQFPVVAESNTSTEISIKHFSKYFFNAGPNAWSFAKVLANAAVKNEGKKNFVFCGTDGAATIDAENLLLLEGQKIDPDFSCLASYRVSSDDSQFSNIISSIASTAPDMVLQQGGGPTFVAFAQQGLMFGLFDNSDVYNDFVVDTSTNSSLAEAGQFPYGHTKGMYLLNFWDESQMDENIKGFCDNYMNNPISQENGYVAPSDAGLSCYRCVKSIALGAQSCVDAGTDYTDPQTLTDAIATDEQAKEDVLVVLDKTPFYAEMGGQAADHGVITGAECSLRVLDVKKTPKGYYVHTCVLESGIVKVGDHLTAKVDKEYRMAIARNHTATHLLQAALREVLGDHVHQAGSLVEPDRLRFDLTHFSAITPDELERVNEIVSDWILDGMDVTVSETSMAQAKASGATALFSEKYGDVVRVVNMGGKSIELCGGTHVDNTAKIGPFRITGESSVASGVRRVEAITGKAYLREMEAVNRRMYAAAEVLHAKPADLIAKAKGFTAELKEARQSVERMKEKILHSDVDRFLYASKNIGGIKVITTTRTDLEAGDLRKLGDFLRDKDPDTVAVLATATESKVTFVAVCGKNAVAKGIRAGDLVRAVSAVTGGKGGGKPDSAMGGGSEVLKIDDALAIVDDFVADKLGL